MSLRALKLFGFGVSSGVLTSRCTRRNRWELQGGRTLCPFDALQTASSRCRSPALMTPTLGYPHCFRPCTIALAFGSGIHRDRSSGSLRRSLRCCIQVRERFLAHLGAQREEHMVLRNSARDVDGAGGFREGVFLDWGGGGEASDGGGGVEGEGLWAYADFWAWGLRGYCEEGCHDGTSSRWDFDSMRLARH